MRMLTGFMTPTSGTVNLDGIDLATDPIAVKAQLGYLPEGAPLYLDMTVLDFLKFCGNIRGVRGSYLKERLEVSIATLQLEEVLGKRIEALSKGFKRRVGFAQAILHDPAVLILDEPTDGLDPNQKFHVRQLIKRLSATKAILISTHLLEEVGAVCTRAMIIAKGKMVAMGTPVELCKLSPRYQAVLAYGEDSVLTGLRQAFAAHALVTEVEEVLVNDQLVGIRLLNQHPAELLAEVNKTARAKNWAFDRLLLEQDVMDNVFRRVTGGEFGHG
jgi:ABC-2 type transport system ATP-binding protein